LIEVIVMRKQREAEDIYSFELRRVDDAPLPPFSAGAHVDVSIRDGLTRQYSLSNHPEEQHRYLIGVLRDPASRGGSVALVDNVKEGDHIHISEPRNHFPLAHEAKRSLLFAGGIGVTPILCMAERLAHVGSAFEMHYCTRSAARTAFMARIQSASFSDQVKFHFDDGAAEQKLDAAAVLAKPVPGTHLYVCGPTGFMDYVLKTAKDMGWPEEQVHREYFAAPVQAQTGPDDSFQVKLASSGQVIDVPPEKTITAALLAHGIRIPVSCESGVCGTCITRVIEGEPDHRDAFFTDEEKAANDQFTPCCSRSKSKLLVLDL
jgi:vanillate O-demethylase ferredoxin subunit